MDGAAFYSFSASFRPRLSPASPLPHLRISAGWRQKSSHLDATYAVSYYQSLGCLEMREKCSAHDPTELVRLIEDVGIERVMDAKDTSPDGTAWVSESCSSSCLHQAAARSNGSATYVLLRAGADPNVKTKNTGETPLDLANSPLSVEVLLQRDAQYVRDWDPLIMQGDYPQMIRSID